MKSVALVAIAVLPLFACASGESSGEVDAAHVDGPVTTIDAPAGLIDAPDVPIDAPGVPIDAPPGPIDAAVDAAVPVDAPIDGMTTGGAVDTCAQALDVTTGAMAAGGVTLTGDTTTYANNVQPPDACTGYGNDGPDAIYQVVVPAGHTITASLTTTWDAAVEIVQPCALATTCLAGRDSIIGSGTETATYATTAAGTYFVVVDSYIPSVYGTYSLLVRVQ